MSQHAAPPVDLIRIRKYLFDIVTKETPNGSVDKLLSEGWIDIEWASYYTSYVENQDMKIED